MKRRPAMMALLAVVAATPACGDLKKAQFLRRQRRLQAGRNLVVFTNGGIFCRRSAPRDQKRADPAQGSPALDGSAKYATACQPTARWRRSLRTLRRATCPYEDRALSCSGRGTIQHIPARDGLRPHRSHELGGLALSPHGDLVSLFPFESGLQPRGDAERRRRRDRRNGVGAGRYREWPSGSRRRNGVRHDERLVPLRMLASKWSQAA